MAWTQWGARPGQQKAGRRLVGEPQGLGETGLAQCEVKKHHNRIRLLGHEVGKHHNEVRLLGHENGSEQCKRRDFRLI